MTIKIITDQAELTKAIDAWGKQGQKWTKLGHDLAMSALHRLADHGDIGPANRLYSAMPKGTKSSAMAEWLLTFGKLAPNDGDDKKAKPFVYAKDKTMNLADAEKKPWYEFKPEPTVLECFDVQAAIRAFIKATEAKAAKAQASTGLELLEQVKGLLGEEEAEGQADPLAQS